MNIIDVINKKRNNGELTREELEVAFNGFLKKEVKDYQMSALLMAICINGMSDQEVFDLTDIFINSGEILDLSSIPGVKVDKHSTGGVGDKTTLIVAPIVASLGIKVPKMSGRGLGLTGGTIDKLESIPGFRVEANKEQFLKQLNDIGMIICSQTDNLVPLDREVYSLRDVTGTVDSVPLIAVSIMSKKIASGADKILIDIKCGEGALLNDERTAKELRDLMIRIGNKYEKEVRCLISDMDTPLGYCVGNALEVAEAAELLEGKIKNNLYDLCVDIASNMVSMAKEISIIDAREEVIDAINSKKALDKFNQFINYQGGRLDDMPISDKTLEIKSTKKGIIKDINALIVARVSDSLGSGKTTVDDKIDPTVGVFLNKQVGDKVELGDTLCTLYYNKVQDNFNITDAFTIEEE
ncbi:MAG: thymidine phosphorylase [Bacilli bacterium]|nr:thymidine phosphorylase [Bacilli bacterium]